MPRTIALLRHRLLLLMMLPALYLCHANALEAACKRVVVDPKLKAEVQKRLRADKNGLIVVLRHTSKCRVTSEGCAKEKPMANCLAPLEPLSDSGDIEASNIGRSLSKMKVNENVRVLHSKFCRATKTALLIFGEKLPAPESNLNSECNQSTTKDCYNWLKEQLKVLGPSGSVFLITHSDNIASLGFQDLDASMPYGVAAVIDPTKEKDQYLGCILWNDWQELADGQ